MGLSPENAVLIESAGLTPRNRFILSNRVGMYDLERLLNAARAEATEAQARRIAAALHALNQSKNPPAQRIIEARDILRALLPTDTKEGEG
jgi:hypothetical protein